MGNTGWQLVDCSDNLVYVMCNTGEQLVHCSDN